MHIIRSVLAVLMIVSSPLSLAQSFRGIYFANTSSSLVHDVIVLQWNGATWLSDLEGQATLPEDHLDSLVLHSMTFRDTIVSVSAGDTITLVEESNVLSEIVVYNRTHLKYIDHRKPRYEFQREPGDCYMLGYYSTGEVILDSITLEIIEVFRNTSRIRVVIWKDDRFLFESQPYLIPDDLKDEQFTLPVEFHYPLSGEVYIGIQFLEVGRDPFSARSHQFISKGGSTYTNANTGITLGGIKVRDDGKILHTSYLNNRFIVQYFNSPDSGRHAPYIGVHYFGSGELLTDFDEFED